MNKSDYSHQGQRREFVKNILTSVAGFTVMPMTAAHATARTGSTLNMSPLIYTTKAALEADLGHPDGTVAIVMHDLNPKNNATYQKVGNRGGGSWKSTFDRLAYALGNGSGFQALGDAAVLRSVDAKLQETVSILDYIPVSEHVGICEGTSTYDCLSAFRAALANQRPHHSQPAPYGAAGPAIYVPAGTYRVSGAIEIKRRVRIYGDGAGMTGGGQASRIIFPANSHGFIIHAFNTIGSIVESKPSTQGAGSILYGLSIEGAIGGREPSHGVWLRGVATIEQCWISRWTGDGVHIVASVKGKGAQCGNANGWAVKNVRISDCKGSGLYVAGSDVNVGVGYQVQCTSIGRWGIHDDSFLGNTYIGCMTAACGNMSQVSYAGSRYYCLDSDRAQSVMPGTDDKVWALLEKGVGDARIYPNWVAGNPYGSGGAYSAFNKNARNVFVGCYSEDEQPPSHVVAPTCIIGGLFGRVTPDSSAVIISNSPLGATINSGLSAVVSVPGGESTASLGGEEAILASTHTIFAPHTFRLRYKAADLVWDYANHDNCEAYRITGPSTSFAFGRSASVPNVFQVNSLWVGNGNNARMLGFDVAPPKSGNYARGDYVRNSDPSIGKPKGWVCVEGGAPGVWISEGNL